VGEVGSGERCASGAGAAGDGAVEEERTPILGKECASVEHCVEDVDTGAVAGEGVAEEADDTLGPATRGAVMRPAAALGAAARTPTGKAPATRRQAA